MNPTREDLIMLGYLKPGDAVASAPKRERKIWLTDSDKKYAERHGLTHQDMKGFKEDMIIEEEILSDRHILAAQEKKDNFNSPQAHYFAW
tara:strand:- start:151 stop:420 length:270 start_codon:yes stop_codon:yes gene_type:complete